MMDREVAQFLSLEQRDLVEQDGAPFAAIQDVVNSSLRSASIHRAQVKKLRDEAEALEALAGALESRAAGLTPLLPS
ncbi:hypothetical protein [Clavibacter michiganensis]|uniref:hypothetical protein n=1 Tax=Clavibacter michiganensis TaxID=28447 RepID=UPI003EBEFD1E